MDIEKASESLDHAFIINVSKNWFLGKFYCVD